MNRTLLSLLVVVCMPSLAAAAPRKPVTRNLVKVAVDKILTVKLAATQPEGDVSRRVEVTMAGTADRCADPAAEVLAFPEGEFEGFDYESYWVGSSSVCGGPTPVDIVHSLSLKVGKTYKYMFIGPGKFNQRVSFRVDKGSVGSLVIKKALAR